MLHTPPQSTGKPFTSLPSSYCGSKPKTDNKKKNLTETAITKLKNKQTNKQTSYPKYDRMHCYQDSYYFCIYGQLPRSKCVQSYMDDSDKNYKMFIIQTYLQSTCMHMLNCFYSCLFANYKLRNIYGTLPNLKEQ